MSDDQKVKQTKSQAETKPTSSFLSHQYVQIIYGVILIALIPIAIIFNTVYFVNNFSDNLDIQLQRQALLVGEVFNETAKERLNQPDQLQTLIRSMAASSNEIYSFDILYPETTDDSLNFRVVASLDNDSLNQVDESVNNVIAWHEGQAIAQLTNDASQSVVAKEQVGDVRFWSVVMPLYDQTREKVGLASLKMSLEIMDRLAAQTLFRSYVLLAITIIIVILLLILNTRMFEYAHLFRKLKEVDEMKDEFISIASHELRTPITAIKGYTDMFSSGDFGQINEHGQKGLKIMQSSIDRLGNLVEDLLNVSRIEQKRLEIKLVKLDTNESLSLIVEELKIQAEGKGLQLMFKPTEVGSIMVDADKFKQIFINLIGNAIKYTQKGTVVVSTKIKEGKVVIKVKDSGIGMSAKQRANLFQKFYRVKSDQTRGIVGTGLGLWITKQLVEMMKGEITVDSIEGVGSEFTVEFSKVK